jgi:hypothetical protein
LFLRNLQPECANRVSVTLKVIHNARSPFLVNPTALGDKPIDSRSKPATQKGTIHQWAILSRVRSLFWSFTGKFAASTQEMPWADERDIRGFHLLKKPGSS